MNNCTDADKKRLLGANIKQIRKSKNLTQDNFSEQIGIEPSSLSNIENGKSFPSAHTLFRIQEKFSVSANDIFNIGHLKSTELLEEEIFDIIRSQNEEKKRLLYRIVKAFDIC